MKHFSRLLMPVCATLVALGVLALGACSNIFSPSSFKDGGEASLTVNIVSDSGRTLLPGMTFSKYRVEVVNSTGESLDPQEVTGTLATFRGIPADEVGNGYAITVIGFTTTPDGEFEAARGTATQKITVGNGNVSVPVTLSLNASGPNGVLSWDITWASAVNVTEATLMLVSTSSVSVSGSPFDLLANDGNVSSQSLAPGYYLAVITLKSDTAQNLLATRTEIVRIDSRLETKWVLPQFTLADFATLVTLSGTVEVSPYITDGANPNITFDARKEGFTIIANRDTSTEIGRTVSDAEGNWAILLKAFAEDTTLTIQVFEDATEISATVNEGDPIEVKATSISDIEIAAGQELGALKETIELTDGEGVLDITLVQNSGAITLGYKYIISTSLVADADISSLKVSLYDGTDALSHIINLGPISKGQVVDIEEIELIAHGTSTDDNQLLFEAAGNVKLYLVEDIEIVEKDLPPLDLDYDDDNDVYVVTEELTSIRTIKGDEYEVSLFFMIPGYTGSLSNAKVILLDADGETELASETVGTIALDEEITVTLTANDTSSDGDGSIIVTFTTDGTDNLTGNYSMFGDFEFVRTPAAPYVVSFNVNGGTGTPSDQDVYHGLSLASLPSVTYAGHTLVGWFENNNFSTSYTTATPITKTVELKAYWVETPAAYGAQGSTWVLNPAGAAADGSFAGWYGATLTGDTVAFTNGGVDYFFPTDASFDIEDYASITVHYFAYGWDTSTGSFQFSTKRLIDKDASENQRVDLTYPAVTAGEGSFTIQLDGEDNKAFEATDQGFTIAVNGTHTFTAKFYKMTMNPPAATSFPVTVAGTPQNVAIDGKDVTTEYIEDGFSVAGSNYQYNYSFFEVDLGTDLLADYEKITFTFKGVSGDVGYKNMSLWASETKFTGNLNENTPTFSSNTFSTGGSPITTAVDASININRDKADDITTNKVWLSIYVPASSSSSNSNNGNSVGPTKYEITNVELVKAGPWQAVTAITGVPTTGEVGTALPLTGTVNTDASRQAIAWSIVEGTNTTVSSSNYTLSGSNLTANEAGTIEVKATVRNGTAIGTDYTQEGFIITFTDAGRPAATLKELTFGTGVGEIVTLVYDGLYNKGTAVEYVTNGYEVTKSDYGNAYVYFQVNLGANYLNDFTSISFDFTPTTGDVGYKDMVLWASATDFAEGATQDPAFGGLTGNVTKADGSTLSTGDQTAKAGNVTPIVININGSACPATSTPWICIQLPGASDKAASSDGSIAGDTVYAITNVKLNP